MDFYYAREYFLLNRNVKLKSYLCTSLALSVASEFVICSHYFADSLLKCDIYIKIELGEENVLSPQWKGLVNPY